MAALTTVEKVRLRIGDTGSVLFTDDQINDFLSENNSNIYLAAADACDTLAVSQAKIALIVEQGNYKKDSRSVARELNRNAKELRKKAAEQPACAIGLANEPLSSHVSLLG